MEKEQKDPLRDSSLAYVLVLKLSCMLGSFKNNADAWVPPCENLV